VVRDNVANCGGGILNDGGILTMVDCTVRDNVADGQAPIGYNCGSGGAVKNVEGGILEMTHCTLVDNQALGKGGALHVSCKSRATLTNCTISGNEVTGRGGGIHSKGQLTLVHCTIQGNKAKGVVRGKGIGDQAAGGLAIRGSGTLTMTATLIANNPRDGDCMLGESAVVTVNEHNWIEDGSCGPAYTGNPALEPLADNGGATWTHALSLDSPARDVIPEEACPVRTDQRGLERTPPCDVGAYERNP
jgi:predicted outer membrane repeat protein